MHPECLSIPVDLDEEPSITFYPNSYGLSPFSIDSHCHLASLYSENAIFDPSS